MESSPDPFRGGAYNIQLITETPRKRSGSRDYNLYRIAGYCCEVQIFAMLLKSLQKKYLRKLWDLREDFLISYQENLKYTAFLNKSIEWKN